MLSPLTSFSWSELRMPRLMFRTWTGSDNARMFVTIPSWLSKYKFWALSSRLRSPLPEESLKSKAPWFLPWPSRSSASKIYKIQWQQNGQPLISKLIWRWICMKEKQIRLHAQGIPAQSNQVCEMIDKSSSILESTRKHTKWTWSWNSRVNCMNFKVFVFLQRWCSILIAILFSGILFQHTFRSTPLAHPRGSFRLTRASSSWTRRRRSFSFKIGRPAPGEVWDYKQRPNQNSDSWNHKASCNYYGMICRCF